MSEPRALLWQRGENPGQAVELGVQRALARRRLVRGGTRFTPADTDKPFGRIDWILIRDDAGQVKVRSHEILRDGDEEAGLYPSDHYPVLAELELAG